MSQQIIDRLNKVIFKNNIVKPSCVNSWISDDSQYQVKLDDNNIELYVGNTEIYWMELEHEFNRLSDDQILRYFLSRLRRTAIDKKYINAIIEELSYKTFSLEYITKLLNASVSKDAPMIHTSSHYADCSKNGKARILTLEDGSFVYSHDLICEITIHKTEDFDQLVEQVRIKLKDGYTRAIDNYQDKIRNMIKLRDSL